MLIEQKPDVKNSLRGKTVLLTGGGGGIGLETAKCLAFMGADIVLAERDEQRGNLARQAVEALKAPGTAVFHQVDLLETGQVEALCDFCEAHKGGVDAIINNATVTPFGALEDLPAYDWDVSYALHLRAPVLILKRLLPGMRRRNQGSVLFIPSSGPAPFMGAYEVLKAAQVALADTLAAELEGTGVGAWCVAPGLVKTETAVEGVEKVSAWMGITTEEFYAMLQSNTLTAEQAGAGIALSLLQPRQYHGRQTSAARVLAGAGLADALGPRREGPAAGAEVAWAPAQALLGEIRRFYEEQYHSWLARSLLERQQVLRNFKKITGHGAEEMEELLRLAAGGLAAKDTGVPPRLAALLRSLHAYYAGQRALLQGYEKDPARLQETSAAMQERMRDIDRLLTLLEPAGAAAGT